MLILFGCNYRSAPLELRERLAFAEADVPGALRRLLDREAVEEALILSTCNRVELLVRSTTSAQEGLQIVKQFVADEREIQHDDLDRHSYDFAGRDAVQHLFQVAAGLDSMILGEPQIHGQVKQAFRVAREVRSTGSVLDRLLQQCLATAKRVRRETGISRHAVSVAFAACHLARQIFGKLNGRTALVLGSGKMGELVARHLMGNGIGEVRVASRNYGRAVASAERFDGRAVRWDEGLAGLSEVDIVVTCTGAPHAILTKKEVAGAYRGRRGQPLFIIDIAVPRDVDPEVNRLDNVYLYDIDGLQEVVDANLEERRVAAAAARQAIARDVAAFARWRQSLHVTPTIVALRENVFGMGERELSRFRSRLGDLTSTQERAVDDLIRSLIQKFLHRPVTHLKKAAERGDIGSSASLYRDVFGLDPRSGADGQERDAPEDAGGRRPGNGPQRLLKGGKED